MSFRFRRRVRLLPGFWLNVSKSGVSASAGVPGLTINTRGIATAGLPGTGISYRQNLSTMQRRTKQKPKLPTTAQLVAELNDILGQGPDSIRHTLWAEHDIGLVGYLQRRDDTPREILELTAMIESADRCELLIRRAHGQRQTIHQATKVFEAIQRVLHYAQEKGLYEPLD